MKHALLAVALVTLLASCDTGPTPKTTTSQTYVKFDVCKDGIEAWIVPKFYVDPIHNVCYVQGYHELLPIDCAVVAQCQNAK